MKKLIIVFFIAALTANLKAAGTIVNNDDIAGNWKYEAPGAPYGYEKGTLIFEEEDGNLTGDVKFTDGYKIELKDIRLEEDGTVKFGLYIDYEYVSVNLKIAEKKMTGTINTPDGELRFSAEKLG